LCVSIKSPSWNGNQCGKNLGNENLKKASLLLIVKGQRLQENLEYFKNLGGMILNDARCIREIKSRIGTANQHSTKRRIFSTAN